MSLSDQKSTQSLSRRTTTDGAETLAQSAVDLLSKRQGVYASGARQFVVDHMMRAVCSKSNFDPGAMLDELRGHRLSVDSVIDTYVPTVARILGELWQTDDVDFATVTVGTMRLQALLSLASVESTDFIRPVNEALTMLIVVPLGEQHTLGAFVLAAQLRRLGARIDMSFCEDPTDLASRVICDVPDMILFTASSRARLEYISEIVQSFAKVLPSMPLLGVGGGLGELPEVAKEVSSVDVVTNSAKDVMSMASGHRRRLSGRRSI